MEYNIDFDRIEAEILACAGLCVNDFNNEPKEILLVNSTNAELLKMLVGFNAKVHCVGAKEADFSANLCVNLAENADKVAFYDLAINLKINKFDLIIDLQNKDTGHYQKLLKNNGILIVDLESLSRENITQKHANFNVLMPFRLQSWGSDSQTKSQKNERTKYYLFASNKFHPLADFSLQKLDMMDNLQFCNAKIYEATFAMPNFVKTTLKGVVRN